MSKFDTRDKLIDTDYTIFLKQMNFKSCEESLTYIDSFSCSVCTKCDTIVDMHEITTDDFYGCKRCLS